MKNFNRLAAVAVLVWGSCLFSPVQVVAEETATPGTSFTYKIVNPGFDDNTKDGWTFDTAEPGVNFNVMEVYNATFNVHQTITGLPAGTYKLTVSGFHRAKVNDGGAAYNAGTEVINAALYASTSEETKETFLPSLYSIKGVTVTGGGKLLNGYVDNMEGANQAFGAGNYTNVTVRGIVVTDGSLTIGVKTLGDRVDRCWTIWDNFQLTYQGEGESAVFQEMIDEVEQKLDNYSYEGRAPSGILKDIEDVKAFKEEYYYSEEKSELEALLDSIRRVEVRAGKAALLMDTLYAQIDVASGLEAQHFPGEAALSEAIGKASDLTYSDFSNLVYAAELSTGIAELRAAIYAYRLTQQPTDSGIDYTWAMKAPNFTKEGGSPTAFSDASSEGWVPNNNAKSGDFRLNAVNGKNCWNNHSGDFTAMDIYQDLENMPEGLYSFSCYQTNDGPSLTDQHAYITAVGGTSVSPYATYSFALDEDPDKGKFGPNSKWEGPLATGKVYVGRDGKLRVGFASTSNKNGSSGWFCITDCQLTYYGMSDAAMKEAMEFMIEDAEALEFEELLPADKSTLKAGIKAAKDIDTSDKNALQEGLKVLGRILTLMETANKELIKFKSGVYADMSACAMNGDGVYSEKIQQFASGVILNADALLEADTTSSAVLPLLTAQFNQCIALVPLTQKAEKVLANTMYEQDARTKLGEVLSTQLDAVKADLSQGTQAESMISYEIKLTTLPKELDPATGRDVTIWLQNPDFEETVGDNGWKNGLDGKEFFVNTGLNTKDTGYSGNSLEAWIKIGQKLADKTISQTMYVPNGTYTLSVVGTACQQGKIMYYEEDGATKKDSACLVVPVKGVWLFANEDSVEMATPMIGESDPYENQIGTNEPHSQAFQLENVKVTDHLLTLGIKTRSTTANWVAFDTFRLTCLEYTTVGVEEVNADRNVPFVYVENGLIKVVGADEFSITTVDGIGIPANTSLAPGIYLVKVNAQTLKIMVK